MEGPEEPSESVQRAAASLARHDDFLQKKAFSKTIGDFRKGTRRLQEIRDYIDSSNEQLATAVDMLEGNSAEAESPPKLRGSSNALLFWCSSAGDRSTIRCPVQEHSGFAAPRKLPPLCP